MKCPKCGAINSENSKYCNECAQVLQVTQNKSEIGIQKTEINPSVTQGKKNHQKYWMIVDATVILLCVVFLGGKLISQLPESKIMKILSIQQKNTEDNQTSAQESMRQSGVQERESEKEDLQQSRENFAAASTSTTKINSEENSSVADIYLLPDSAIRLISEFELSEFTAWELRVARNEIYARHGRKFNDINLQNYFDSQEWYSGTIAPDDFDDMMMLNDIEKANLDIIMGVEEKLEANSFDSDSLSSQTVETDNTIIELDISNQGITSLDFYANSTALEVFYIYYNPVSDATALAKLTNLKVLGITGTNITDINCLSTLVKLEYFYCGESNISDISVVKNFPNLKEIDFWYTPVSDISALSDLTQLEGVYMSYTNVTTLQPLMNLPNLQVLSISGLSLLQVEYNEFVTLHPNCIIYQEGTKFY